ncbi:MAG: sigma 54-interacting transcriptional regulator [Kiritimatiellae bacterium]|nr:sigma 54-interacting transcriptional regulator [Kiritimatiellia bacterium]
MKEEEDISLEGEDVCVCVGCCEDDAMPRWTGRIAMSGATMVVCLYNPCEPSSCGGVEKFAQTLERNLPVVDVRRRILVMSADDWGCIYSAHREETYSIVHFHIDASMALPSSAANMKPRTVPTALRGFDDVAPLKELLLKIVEVFAKSPNGGMWPSVLLLGETGSGKTYAAQKIYDTLVESGAINPKENEGQFVSLNCGEFGREDMNGALLGIKGGVFTGIPRDMPGAIAKAQGGVLFLDEIGTLPMELQPRLLTVLDGGKYRMHGAAEATEDARCRFVFGTNEDLAQAVREGHFRFDLYNRIAGMVVHMPSVKERIDGNGGRSFLDSQMEMLCAKHGRLRVTSHARAVFLKFAKQHPWRGNFRELNRCFQIMGMKSDCRNIVSAFAMGSAIDEIVRNAQSEDAFIMAHSFIDEYEHPLLKDRRDIPANEKAMLSFAFKCAETSINRRDAGRRFYAGKHASTNFNWGDSFVKYIARFGFKWNSDVRGHVVATESADS